MEKSEVMWESIYTYTHFAPHKMGQTFFIFIFLPQDRITYYYIAMPYKSWLSLNIFLIILMKFRINLRYSNS